MTNLEAARELFEHLLAAGVGCVVHAPGARNLPLLAALQELSQVERVSCVDERAAAFLALGWMRGRLLAGNPQPAVVLCTSGTAALNLLPATAEARESGLPLVLLTADRPAEEIGRGANQTVDQVGPFTPLVQEQVVLPCAHSLKPRDLGQVVDAALSRALVAGGPVHINMPFAEPLLGDSNQPAPAANADCHPVPESDACALSPVTQEEGLGWKGLEAGARRGLVWVCDLPDERDRQAARALSRLLGWPLLADGGSGLCHRVEGDPPLLLNGEDLLHQVQESGAVLQLGKRPVSRRMAEALRGRPGLVVDAHPGVQDGAGAGWPRWRRSPGELLQLVTQEGLALPCAEESWCQLLAESQMELLAAQADVLREEGAWSEATVLRRLCATLPAAFPLLAGNSLPIRLLDQWRPGLEHDLRVAANRGLSGIDGLLATALGLQLGAQIPTALLVGDLSLRHDLGSLALLAEAAAPLLVVAIHNGGGGIFRLQRDSAPHAWARQDHELDLARAAAGLGLEAVTVDAVDALQVQLDAFVESPRPLVVQCRVAGEDHPRRQHSLARRLALGPAPAQEAPRRIFLHGFLGSPDDWRATRQALNSPTSAEDLCLTLPGHGPLAAAPPARHDQWVEWLLSQWPAHEAVDLVGYSMGGRLALAAALAAPGRVASLELLGASPGVEGSARRLARREHDEAWARLLEEEGLSAFLERWYAQPLFAPLMEKADSREFLGRRAEGSAPSLAQVLRAMSQGRVENHWPRLAELGMPVLWLAGGRDTGYVASSTRAAARTARGSLHEVQGAGHALPLEAPGEVACILERGGRPIR